MPTKRAQVAENPYKPHASAIEKLTGSAAAEDYTPGTGTDAATVIPQNSSTADTGDTAAPEKPEKVTFYLRRDQVEKLDELVFTYNRRAKRRINRNDIVRQLIDHADLTQVRGRDERA